MTRLIYLASPYSHQDPEVRQDRYEQACQAAADLIGEDVFVYSPIAHTHNIALKMPSKPLSFSYWQNFDFRMINACDELMVRRLDGWEDSVGVEAEIEYARKTGKPVSYI